MKKQTKADKAFINKIKTVGISTGGGKPKHPPHPCPHCVLVKPVGIVVERVGGNPALN